MAPVFVNGIGPCRFHKSRCELLASRRAPRQCDSRHKRATGVKVLERLIARDLAFTDLGRASAIRVKVGKAGDDKDERVVAFGRSPLKVSTLKRSSL